MRVAGLNLSLHFKPIIGNHYYLSTNFVVALTPPPSFHKFLSHKVSLIYIYGDVKMLENFVTPDDVKMLVRHTLNHRIILKPEAELEGASVHSVIDRILRQIGVPGA